MKRNVYLVGEMAEKFGEKFSVDSSSYPEILKCINANREGFLDYLAECHENNIAFTFHVENDPVQSQDEIFMPLEQGDITITPVPAGAKSAGSKILAAVLIAATVFFAPGTAFIKAGALTKVGTAALAVSVNLALAGVQQLLMPDPATDEDSPQSYLFNGSEQNVIEGDPVPVLYGELRVPGTPISFEVVNREFSKNNVRLDDSGNLILET